MILSDIRELKSVLEIDPADSSEDKRLLFFLEHVSDWIEEWLNRKLFYKTRTEFYKGTGTQKLLLRARPVVPAPTDGNSALTVYEDTGANFGSTTGSFDPTTTLLTYGTDYCLDIDQDNGTSRSGILYRINDAWFRPTVRARGWLYPFQSTDFGSYKIIYTAGFTMDTLPATIREACNIGVARLRYVWPLGLPLSSESYEERSISVMGEVKNYLYSMMYGQIIFYRNWKF